MKKTQRIALVQRVIGDLERRKAEALALCEQRVRETRARLHELEDYRATYLQDFHRRAQTGLDGAGAREYQVFLSRLDEALQHQSQLLGQAELQRTSELESWRSAARRVSQIDSLAGHWRAEERGAEERREQRETDERSQQQWSRGRSIRAN
jgi:flagellar FliJ protein